MHKVEKRLNKPVWVVKLDKKIAGEIRFLIDGDHNIFQYFPKGSATGGEKFETLNACINSLEG